jgi:hypothetical protein
MPRNERLRQQRIARNWRQQEVADQLGIALVTVQRYTCRGASCIDIAGMLASNARKTDAFSMVGTWHIQWSCSDQSSQYLTINLYDYDSGIVLESWQNPCTIDQFDKTVTSTGIFQIEGVIADSGATYDVAVLQ